MGKTRGTKPHLEEKPKIVITCIRDLEGNRVPRAALNSVVKHVLDSIADLGLKANVETVDTRKPNSHTKQR